MFRQGHWDTMERHNANTTSAKATWHKKGLQNHPLYLYLDVTQKSWLNTRENYSTNFSVIYITNNMSIQAKNSMTSYLLCVLPRNRINIHKNKVFILHKKTSYCISNSCNGNESWKKILCVTLNIFPIGRKALDICTMPLCVLIAVNFKNESFLAETRYL